MVFLHKKIFLARIYKKLQHKKYDHYSIINKMICNSYVIDLLENIGIFKISMFLIFIFIIMMS